VKKIVSVLIILGFFVVYSCGDGRGNSSEKATKHANHLCDCAMDADIEFDGISNFYDFRQLERQIEHLSKTKQRMGVECVLIALKGIQEDIKDMNEEEGSEYMIFLGKATSNTKCGSEMKNPSFLIKKMENMSFNKFKYGLVNLIERGESELAFL
tara:strand:+ start:77 stop:541 length:465 start_codon:yes stop_codon:yes gene_type:complete